MAVIINSIRWADNTEELKKNLREGINTLDVMKQQVDRTAQAMGGTGLYGAAAKLVVAIDQVGGVTKLTAAEQQRALATLDKAIEKYRVMGQVAPQALLDTAEAMRPHQGILSGMLGSLSSLGNSWVARIAEGVLLRDAIRGILNEVKQLAGFLPEIALKGAAVADVEENFNHLAKAAGLAGDALMGRLREGTHNTVDNFALMKTVNKDLAAGMALTEKQFGTLATGAFALAQATGGDVKTAFDTMNDAMLTGRTRSLAELTGKIQTTAAEEKFAAAMKHSADQLTEEGKLQAARVAILDAVTEATARLGEQTDGLDEKVAQVSVAWENFKDDLGKTIATSATLGVALDGVGEILVETFGGDKKRLIDVIADAVDSVTISLVDLGAKGVEAGGFIAKEWFALEKVFGNVVQVVDGVRLAFMYANLEAAKIASWTDKSPKIKADIKAIDESIGELLITMKRRGEALQAADKAQGEVDATTAKYVKRLEDLKAKVEAARDASKAHAAAAQDEGAADETAGAAAKKHGDELFKLNEAQKKFAEAIAEMTATGMGWLGTLETIDGAVVEAIKYYLQAGVSQDKLAIAYGLTASQIHAVAESLKEEAEVRKIVNAATKEASDSTRAWLAETTKAASEYVKAHTTAYQKALDIAEKTNDEIALSGVSGKMREIRALEQKEKAEIDALAFLRKEYPKVYDELVGVVKQKYALMTAEAIGSSQDIIDVAHQLGLKTKEDIAGNLELARNNYKALKDSGVLSIGELRKAWEKLHQAELDADDGVSDFKENLDKLSAGLNALAQASGGTFGGIVQDIAKAVAALKIASDSATAFKKAVATNDKTGMAIAGVGMASAFAASTAPNSNQGTKKGQVTGALSGAASGLAMGATIGSFAGPAGTVAGAVIGTIAGGIIGFLRNLGPSAAEKSGREIEKSFEDSFGGFTAMTKTIAESYNFIGKSNAQAEADVKRLLAAEKQGGDAVKAVIADIQKQIDLGKQAVAALPGIMQAVASGLSAVSVGTIGVINKAVDKAKSGAKDADEAAVALKGIAVTAQPEFDRVGRLAVTAFNAAIAGGQTFAQAIAGIAPTLGDLSTAQESLGLASSATLTTLLGFSKFAENNKELIGTLDGVNQMMTGLHQMGLLTQTDFNDLNAITVDTFDKMKAGGVAGDTALRAMQPSLQKIWELQQDFGFEVDEGTQALLDQAKTQGIVGEQMRSVQQQTLDVLKAIAKALGAEIPGAAKDGAEKTQKALDGIHAPDLTIHVGYEYDNPEDPQQHATGGFVSGARGFAIGGIAGRATPTRMAIGSGTDTVPAMLTPGELVLNVAQQRNVAAAITGSGQARGGGGGAVTNNVYQIQATDVDSFKRLLDKEGIPYIFAELRHNRRGGLTNVADAVS